MAVNRQRRAHRRRAERYRRAAAANDRRVVVSQRCSWWDTIAAADRHPDSGLPCCPSCRSMLYEWPSESAWLSAVATHADEIGDDRFPMFAQWSKGRCGRVDDLRAEFEAVLDRQPKGSPVVRSMADKYRAAVETA